MRNKKIWRKVCASMLLVAFAISNLLVTPVLADDESTVSLAAGSYIVSITKMDSSLTTSGERLDTTMAQPQISEVGILTVTSDGAMSLRYKLYGTTLLTNVALTNGASLEMKTANEAEYTYYIDVPVQKLNEVIALTDTINDATQNYGIRIDEIGSSVEELENAAFTGQSLQYDFTYAVYKPLGQANYVTEESLSSQCNFNIYAALFEQNVKMECANEAATYPLAATFTINTELDEQDSLVDFSLLQSVSAPVSGVIVDGYKYKNLYATYKTGNYLSGASFNQISDGSSQQITLTYNDVNDLVFGKDVRFDTKQTAETTAHYYGRLHPVLQSSMSSYEDITFTDDATGVMVESSTRSFPESYRLQVDVNSDGAFYSSSELESAGVTETKMQTYYEAFSGMAESDRCVVYTLSMTDADGNLLNKDAVLDNAVITLPIPEGWDVTSDQKLAILAYSNCYGSEQAGEKLVVENTSGIIYTIDYANQQIVIDARNLKTVGASEQTWQYLTRGSFVLYVESESVNPSQLNDGIYQVNVRTSKTTNTGEPSMSNAAFSHTAYLVKNGKQQDLYLRFHSLTVNGMVAYIGGLDSIDAATGDEFGATYYDYYTEAEAGGSSNSLLSNAGYDADTGWPCVQAMKLQLNSAEHAGRWSEAANGYNVAVVPPVMAAINHLPADQVTSMGCTILLSNAQMLTSDTSAASIAQFVPVYEEQPDVLRRAIDAAKKLYVEADYTADSYQALTKALTTAEAVYAVGSTGAAVVEQVEAIQAAVDGLVSLSNVDKSKLETALNNAKAINNEDGTYTEISFQALTAAIKAAQAVFDDKLAGQANVDAQVAALNNAVNALIRSNQLAEGEVAIPVILKKAYDTSDSMGNASLEQEGVLKVNADGSATVRLNFHSMSFSGFEGYLGYLKVLNKDTVGRNDLGGWDYDDSDFMDVLTVAAQYDYMPNDEYTGDNSTDPDIGKTGIYGPNYQYPKSYELYIADFDTNRSWWETVYVQVYAPVMASVEGTSGRQEARLLLDFSNYDPTGDVDVSALKAVMDEAQILVDAGKDAAVSDDSWEALTIALKAAEDLLNRTVTETQVAAQTAALQSAMDSVRIQMEVDKSNLSTLITVASGYHAEKYTAASYAAMDSALTAAKAVEADAAASQSDVNAQVVALDAAMKALVEEVVVLPALADENDSYEAKATLGEGTALTVEQGAATVVNNENETAFHLQVVFTGNNVVADATTASSLRFVAYDRNGEYVLATGSALQFVSGGAQVQLENIAADTEQVTVYLGYVWENNEQQIMSLSLDEDIAAYGCDGVVETVLYLDWSSAYKQAYPEQDTSSLERSIAEAQTMLNHAAAAGATEEQIAALRQSIAAAEDIVKRNSENKATEVQLENAQTALTAMMKAMPMAQVAEPVISFDKASAVVGDVVKVIIETATEGAQIFYTEDGTEPSTTSRVYQEDGFNITLAEAGTKIIKAIAYKTGMEESVVATAAINFATATPDNPTIPGGGGGGNTSTDEEENYYVPVELQKQYTYESSMGNVAFANNPYGLAVKNSNGTYDILVATNPVSVSGYTSAIVSINGQDYTIEALDYGSVDTTTKFDGTVHTLNYISMFKILNVPYGTKNIVVSFDVPYTPMDWAVSGGLGARLYFDWDSAEATSDTSLTPDSSTAKGATDLLSESVDITDDATGVRLVADEDVLPEGTALTVDAITSGSSFDTATKALDGIAEQFKLYNIQVKADGEDVEPSTTVKLYLPIPSDYDSSKVAVYRINSDGTKVVVKGTVEDGKYVIETKTFGLYAVALTDTVQQVVVNTTYDEAVAKVVEKYPDINNHWAASSIAFVVNRGLMGGVADGQFGPNMQLTRGMLVTILGRLEGFDASKYTGSSFSDVSADAWYAPSVQWAAEMGIVSGVGDGKFAPDQAITREQLAAILANYAAKKNIELKDGPSVKFADSNKISPWAASAMDAMVKAGIIRGNADGTLNPQGTATRAEVATMLQRFIVNYVDVPVEQD